MQLYHQDHFAELSDREPWELHQWMSEEPQAYLETYRKIVARAPFDIMVPMGAFDRHLEFVRREGQVFLHDRRDDSFRRIDDQRPGQHPLKYTANETQQVFSRDDVGAIEVVTAEARLAAEDREGSHTRAVIREFGEQEFIADFMVGVLWGCQRYLGQTNMLRMLIEDPDLIRCLSDRIVEQYLEDIRFHCAVGYDGLFIDDAMAYSDVISVAHYERFCLPYLKVMVEEIHRLGRKAILIYFGGVSDRLEQIASCGADGLLVETSMKSYTNDIVSIAEQIGSRLTLFGNLDPIRIMEKGTDAQLEAEIERQAQAARKSRGFIMSTGSPLTPATPLARVQRYLQLARQLR